MAQDQAGAGQRHPGSADEYGQAVNPAFSQSPNITFSKRIGLITKTDGFEPVNQESTASIIARQLRTAIMYGALPPGSQLGEADLAARFRVSRGPLREAMQRLVQEGLLRSARNRGLFVITLEPRDVQDIYVARAAIERTAVSLIIKQDSVSKADRLDRAADEIRDAIRSGIPNAVVDADFRFHERLIAESDNSRLIRMYGTLLVESRMWLTTLGDSYRSPDNLIPQCDKLIAALRTGDAKGAYMSIDEHLEDALRLLG